MDDYLVPVDDEEIQWYYSIYKEFYAELGYVYEMFSLRARNDQEDRYTLSTWSTYEEAYIALEKIALEKEGKDNGKES